MSKSPTFFSRFRALSWPWSPTRKKPPKDVRSKSSHTLHLPKPEMDVPSQVINKTLFDKIVHFLPIENTIDNWKMLYSLQNHGAALCTLYDKAQYWEKSVLAVETATGEIFGCFTSSPWAIHPNFYGGSPCFVFSSKARDIKHEPKVYLSYEYIDLLDNFEIEQLRFASQDDLKSSRTKHSGENRFDGCMLAHPDMIGLGRGDFAFTIDSNLQFGNSGCSDTFRNDLLVEVSPFECINVELWGIGEPFEYPKLQRRHSIL